MQSIGLVNLLLQKVELFSFLLNYNRVFFYICGFCTLFIFKV